VHQAGRRRSSFALPGEPGRAGQGSRPAWGHMGQSQAGSRVRVFHGERLAGSLCDETGGVPRRGKPMARVSYGLIRGTPLP